MFNTTDLGNSERFVERHGDKVRFAREWGWLYYDGRRWLKVDQARIVELAKDAVRAMQREATDFDANTWLLNVLDGTIDLKTGELRAHNPNDLITKLAPVEYHGVSDGARFEAFLLEVFSNDVELIDYVQRAIGVTEAMAPKAETIPVAPTMRKSTVAPTTEYVPFEQKRTAELIKQGVYELLLAEGLRQAHS